MARYLGSINKRMRLKGLLNLIENNKLKSEAQKYNFENIHTSEYSKQLKEKQKLKIIYCILERQFKKHFKDAYKKKGNTGINLFKILESRLDNIVYRMGFGKTRSEARQIICHKTIKVNNKTVNIPSYILKVGDIIKIRKKFHTQKRIINSLILKKKNGFPNWVSVDIKKFKGIYNRIPNRNEIYEDIDETLIIEWYSK